MYIYIIKIKLFHHFLYSITYFILISVSSFICFYLFSFLPFLFSFLFCFSPSYSSSSLEPFFLFIEIIKKIIITITMTRSKPIIAMNIINDASTSSSSTFTHFLSSNVKPELSSQTSHVSKLVHFRQFGMVQSEHVPFYS